MDAAGNIVVLHPLLKLAQQWASSPENTEYEHAFMHAINQDAVKATTPIFVVHHCAKLAPWQEGDARMLTWTHIWLRHTLLRASTMPAPAFTEDDSFSLTITGAWLRGRAEKYGAGVDLLTCVELHNVWSKWTACIQAGFTQSAQGVLTLHFVLGGSYLHDALYPNMKSLLHN